MVLISRGNNLHEVQSAGGDVFLVSMPTKFRKNVWIKRGDYVMIEPIAEGDKVKAEISHILYRPQVKFIQQQGLWPEQFRDTTGAGGKTQQDSIPDDMLPPSESESDASDAGDVGPICNPNRQEQLREANIIQDSDNSDDCDDNQQSECIHPL